MYSVNESLEALQKLSNQNKEQAEQIEQLVNEQKRLLKESAEKQARLVAQEQQLQETSKINSTVNQQLAGGIYPNNTFNTFQFFNGSLAKDVFNRNGNVINGEYKFLARRAAGMETQGNTAYQTSLNNLNGPIGSAPANSTGVGWTNNKDGDTLLKQKYWAWWVVQLTTMSKIAAVVNWETEDFKLKIALYKLYKTAMLTGWAAIKKTKTNWKVFEVQNIKRDEDGEITSYSIQDATWFLDGDMSNIPEDDDRQEIQADNREYQLLQWDVDGYNVWFYTIFYTLDFIDIEWEWVSRVFFERAILFQLVGSDEENATSEYQQISTPGIRVIKVKTAGIESADNFVKQNGGSIVVGNKYAYTELGNIQDTAQFQTFSKLWLNLWDSLLGIVPMNSKMDASRSTTDESSPTVDVNRMLQNKYGLTVQLFTQEFKEKFGIELTAKLAIEEAEENKASQQERGMNNDEQPNASTNDQSE